MGKYSTVCTATCKSGFYRIDGRNTICPDYCEYNEFVDVADINADMKRCVTECTGTTYFIDIAPY